MMTYLWFRTHRERFPKVAFPGWTLVSDVTNDGKPNPAAAPRQPYFTLSEFIDANYDRFPEIHIAGARLCSKRPTETPTDRPSNPTN